VRDTLDVWPSLPLVIQVQSNLKESVDDCYDDIVAALGRRDRVDRIEFFGVTRSPLETVLGAMQVPFPELTHVQLSSNDKTVPILPDLFLGRSAPRLRFFRLVGIPFPGLPNLLLSATHLVNLSLVDIPHSGYISPDSMATALSALTDLESLSLDFQSPRSRPDRASRYPPPIRTVLPVLTDFWFRGVSEYLDDLVARIDAPRLIYLTITFFNDIVFDTPRFIQFISRSPTLKVLKNAHVVFGHRAASIGFSQTSGYGSLEVRISCGELDWQVSSLEQVCASCLVALSMSEDLHIYQDPYSQPDWEDNIENSLWLELLHPFATVKNLYLSKEFALRIAPALQELVEGRTTEVLPSLQNIFVEELEPSGPVRESIGKFVVARQLSGRSVIVSLWERASVSLVDESR
jgi:hypothetical protein